MNPITKLLREQKEEFEKLGELYSVYSFGTMDLENKTDEVNDWHTTAQQQLIDVIIETIKNYRKQVNIFSPETGNKFVENISTLLEDAKKNV